MPDRSPDNHPIIKWRRKMITKLHFTKSTFDALKRVWLSQVDSSHVQPWFLQLPRTSDNKNCKTWRNLPNFATKKSTTSIKNTAPNRQSQTLLHLQWLWCTLVISNRIPFQVTSKLQTLILPVLFVACTHTLQHSYILHVCSVSGPKRSVLGQYPWVYSLIGSYSSLG
jgi:hypothetical protein